MENPTNDKLAVVMRKLQKLKKLYEGAKAINSEGEAANAARLLNKLLTEYNLTMDEIKDVEKNPADDVNHEFLNKENKIGGAWHYHLLYVICKYNFCHAYKYGKQKYMIVGAKENMVHCRWLHEVLAQRFAEFSVQRWKEYIKTDDYLYDLNPVSRDTYRRNYLQAAVQGLDAKLREEKEAEKKANEELSSRVTALVVRTDTALTEYVIKKWGKVGTSRERQTKYNADAYRKGYQDGKNTNINRAVEGKANTSAGYLN